MATNYPSKPFLKHTILVLRYKHISSMRYNKHHSSYNMPNKVTDSLAYCVICVRGKRISEINLLLTHAFTGKRTKNDVLDKRYTDHVPLKHSLGFFICQVCLLLGRLRALFPRICEPSAFKTCVFSGIGIFHKSVYQFKFRWHGLLCFQCCGKLTNWSYNIYLYKLKKNGYS